MSGWLKRFVLAVVALAGLSSGLAAQTHPALKDADFPPLLPIALMADAGRETRSNFQVSPDGKTLSWLQRADGRRQIHIRPIEGGEATVVRTPQDVGTYQWAADSRHLSAPIDPVAGTEDYQILIVDSQAPTATPRNITPWPGTRNSVLVFRDLPDTIYLLSNRRDRRYFDLYRVALPVTGEPQMMAENRGRVSRWMFDSAGKVIARQTRPDANGRRSFERCTAVDACSRLFDLDLEDQVSIVGDAAGDASVWALSNRNRDKVAAVRLDLNSGTESVLYADPSVDVTGLHLGADRREAAFATSWPDRQKLHFFDPALEADLKPLRGEPDDVVNVTSADRAQRWVVVTVAGPQRPTRTLLLDRQTRQLNALSSSPWEAWRSSLSPLRSATVTARDGRPIPVYVTVPRGTSGRGLPTVMLIHGGPWLRDFGTSSPTVQFLANRGYAVVQVNYRGSAGYGKDHLWAGVGEFGRKMSDDIDDAAKWAVDQGIADAGRIALMGGSYGGYATNMGLARTPLLYAAGVSFVGLSDLPAFIDLLPDYWEPHRWHRFLGKPGDQAARARMWEASPLRLVGQVERPMLIIHGANDPRVRRDQGERFAGALKSLGKPVELHVFADEGHGLNRPGNRARYYTMVETFLARHLGGRASPPRGAGPTTGTEAPASPAPAGSSGRQPREPTDNPRR
ncbi:MAG TPA: S9 family peptidase [Vineibacter sp.]|nr:S9 family peptidase [Vineibacter sp.]